MPALVPRNATGGLDTQDIIGIALGVPAGVFAFISVIIAFYAWRYPRSPIGKVGKSVQRVVRGGNARGGNAQGTTTARGGDATAGSVTLKGDAQSLAAGGNAHGGHGVATGEARGGDARGGDVSMT
ncbi:hypothetical protein SAMD00023353_7900020 [Rosellinia necatrix]|uniref:Uncharacterized protein n=1 Tax=Rosellinia necatrix TaxID=77044 RepID=A0A1W2TV34_ROSNE|nr:hypothetical protein SAMD00023353_7900020 [Rosellinia necatrix]